MNITDLIARLEDIRQHEGDVEVRANNECGDAVRIVEEDVYAYAVSNGARLLMIDA